MNSPANPQAKRHIGQILIDQGILTEDQLRIALLEQMKSHLPIGRLLVPLGFVSEDTLRDALADTNNIVAVDQLRAHLKGELEIELRLAGDSEIERAIEHYYGHEFSIDGILREIETGELDYTSIAEGDEYSQP